MLSQFGCAPRKGGGFMPRVLQHGRHVPQAAGGDEVDPVAGIDLGDGLLDVLVGCALGPQVEVALVPRLRQRHQVDAAHVVPPLVAELEDGRHLLEVEALGDARHQRHFGPADAADVVQRLQLQVEGPGAGPQLAVGLRVGAVVGDQDGSLGRDQLAAVVLVGQLQAVGDHARGEAVGARLADEVQQVRPHGRLAAEELDGRQRVVLGEVVEDLVEVLRRRLEAEAHAGGVVDADGAVEVAAVRHVDEDERRVRAVPALQAVQAAGLVVVAGVQRALGLVSAGLAGDEGLRLAAGRAVLDQQDTAVAALGPGRHELLAAIAVRFVHASCFPRTVKGRPAAPARAHFGHCSHRISSILAKVGGKVKAARPIPGHRHTRTCSRVWPLVRHGCGLPDGCHAQARICSARKLPLVGCGGSEGPEGVSPCAVRRPERAQGNSPGLQPQDCPRKPHGALKGRGEVYMAFLRGHGVAFDEPHTWD